MSLKPYPFFPYLFGTIRYWYSGGSAIRTLPRYRGAEEIHGDRFIVVVQSPLLLRVVGRNGDATFSRDPTIRLPPIVWNFYQYGSEQWPTAGRIV